VRSAELHSASLQAKADKMSAWRTGRRRVPCQRPKRPDWQPALPHNSFCALSRDRRKFFAQPPGCWLQSSDAANRAPKEKNPNRKRRLRKKYLEAFRWMLLTRTFEERLASMYRGGRITGGVYIGKGQEAVSVACGIFYRKETSSRLSFVTRPAARPLVNRWSMSHAPILVRGRDRCEDAMATFTAANHATASWR